MSGTLSTLLYLASGILFILALRGLSSPESARQGNIFGIVGMALAIVVTLVQPGMGGWWLIILGIVIGGAAGTFIALKIEMTALPQLVAAFHSLVGLAAVLVAAAALYAPRAFDIGVPGDIHKASLVEMSIGVAIGAVTFTGSVIAFLKLDGRMSGKPILLPLRHLINIALAVLLVLCIVWFVRRESHAAFWILALTRPGMTGGGCTRLWPRPPIPFSTVTGGHGTVPPQPLAATKWWPPSLSVPLTGRDAAGATPLRVLSSAVLRR